MYGRSRTEWATTAILLVSALLAVSLVSLGHRTVVRTSAGVERYPDLYADAQDDFVLPDGPTVYFTFDDGPSRNTEQILDVLQEHEIKATFFVTGQEEDTEFVARMLRRMRDEGHTIALHTFTHDFSTIYRSLDDYLDDLDRINQFVVEATGVRPVLMRFPGGSRTINASEQQMREIADEVTRRGYIFHDWTVVSGDDGAYPAPVEQLVDAVLSGISGKQVEVILFHDNSIPTTTPQALQQLIPALREKGYAFDRLTPQTPPVQRINNLNPG